MSLANVVGRRRLKCVVQRRFRWYIGEQPEARPVYHSVKCRAAVTAAGVKVDVKNLRNLAPFHSPSPRRPFAFAGHVSRQPGGFPCPNFGPDGRLKVADFCVNTIMYCLLFIRAIKGLPAGMSPTTLYF
ncbi:hypothetical protein TTRE_0000577801 [Trichuris trichiura]|uniref:Uncharacterized protein n=1 Tax=Trichuris trichiura TaxID=36087 RepID=A0A077ZAZ9_TRITR|nr:hypothetical protein TTRE_0000577801 [Trichuris trichiura]